MVISVLPFVVIDSPAEGEAFATEKVTVTGRLLGQATAAGVNGIAGTVRGSSFSVVNVPIVEGRNVLTATAVGEGRLLGRDSVMVSRDTTPPLRGLYCGAAGAVTTLARLRRIRLWRRNATTTS